MVHIGDGAPLIVFIVAIIVYWNTLNADFVYDDSRAIVTNADVIGTNSWTQLFSNDFWGTPLNHSGSHKSYRPLTVLSFRLNHSIGALQPFGYHLVNIILHAIASLLVFIIFTKLFISLRVELHMYGALIFATHPIHTEAVAGVVGRADVLATICFLLGLIAFVEYRSVTITVVCAICATLCKEYGITLLPICMLISVIDNIRPVQQQHSSTPIPTKNQILTTKKLISYSSELILLGIAFILLLLGRLWLINFESPTFSASDNPTAHCIDIVTRTLTFAYLPVFNAYLLLIPHRLCFDWSMDAIPMITSFTDYRTIFTIIFYSLMILFILRTIQRLINNNNMNEFDCYYNRRSPSPRLDINANEKTPKINNNNHDRFSFESIVFIEYTIAFALLVIPFIPAINIVAYVGFVVAERILYLPSVGYCALIICGLNQLLHRFDTQSPIKCSAIALLFIFGAKSIDRNRDWYNEESLYRSGIDINPAKGTTFYLNKYCTFVLILAAYANLGSVLARDKSIDEAELVYRRALSYRPNMADTHYNLGTLLQEQHRYVEAIDSYRRAIVYRQSLASAYLNLGLCLWDIGRLIDAEHTFRQCATLDCTSLKDPRSHTIARTSCLYNLGRLLVDIGRYDDAIKAYQQAIDMRPVGYHASASLFNMMGDVMTKIPDRLDQAEQWYRQALIEKPDHIPAHLTFGHLRLKQVTDQKYHFELLFQGRQLDAEYWFLRAVKLNPLDANVHQHLAQFYQHTNQLNLAINSYQQAFIIDSNNADLLISIGNIYRELGDRINAESYISRAIDIRPDSIAYANYGAILHLNGKYAHAQIAYQRALQLNANDDITKDNMKKLQRLISKQQ